MDAHLLRFRTGVKYCLIDLETLNLCLNFSRNRPWQIGVLEVLDEKIIASHNVLIKWNTELKISKRAAFLTKFSQEKLDRLGISPEEALEIIYPPLQKADYVIIHNGLRFDLHLLKEYFILFNRDWKFLLPKIIDTKSIAQGIKMGIPFNPKTDNFQEYQYRMANAVVKGIKTSLTTLGKEFNIKHDYENLHDAECDLQLNLAIWNKLKFQLEY